MRILYVEDNEVNQALVERVLRAKQCSVVFREEGEGALEALANDPEINLILLDIELAGSMNGLDVIRAMRARNDYRPVVAITAYAMMGDRERFLEAGCDQYLPKPLVITDLLNLLDEYEVQFARKADGKSAAQPAAEAAPVESTAAETAPATPALAETQAAAASLAGEIPARAPVASRDTGKPTSAATPVLMPAVKPAGNTTPGSNTSDAAESSAGPARVESKAESAAEVANQSLSKDTHQ
jgi:CheY-like chemotaxis protein